MTRAALYERIGYHGYARDDGQTVGHQRYFELRRHLRKIRVRAVGVSSRSARQFDTGAIGSALARPEVATIGIQDSTEYPQTRGHGAQRETVYGISRTQIFR